MKIYVEAYDANGRQILGNLDGQGAWDSRNYRKTPWYRELPTLRTLNNRVAYYQIVTPNHGTYGSYRTLETIKNITHKSLGERA